MKDFLNKKLTEGDYVLYTKSHNNIFMGRVEKINPKTVRVRELKPRTLEEKTGRWQSHIRYGEDVLKMDCEHIRKYQT